MTINPVSVKIDKKNNLTSQKPSFGNANLVVQVMESIERGGYMASFVVQDGCGFVAPRIGTGLYRNKDKTGEYNWKFAATEAIRELLSGPCMVAIPFAMLYFAKKYFGKANDVPVKFIDLMGSDFAEFAKTQTPAQLKNPVQLKRDYYTSVMKGVLQKATDNKITTEELEDQSKRFVDRILEIERAPKKAWGKKFLNKPQVGSSYDLLNSLTDEFVAIRKKHAGALDESVNLEFSTLTADGKVLKTQANFKKFLTHLKNFTEDATNVVSSKFVPAKESVADFLSKFKHQRVASRFLLILGMDIAVGAFLAIIPKLYKHKDGNPGLKGLDVTSAASSKDGKEGK